MTITLRSVKGFELSHAEMDENFTDLRDGVAPMIVGTTGNGIKVDSLGTPAWGWRDLTAAFVERGAASFTLAAYNGTSYYALQSAAAASKELYIEFHMPHDYVPGSDMFIHAHWSQTTADPGTAVKWFFDVLYARGHSQEAFPAAVTTVSVVQNASSTARMHQIAEVQLSTSGAIGGNTLEVDGIILVRMYRVHTDAADTITQPVFAHFCDIHYQSTNMATKGKAPSFYA